jgi:hypothetical protein
MEDFTWNTVVPHFTNAETMENYLINYLPDNFTIVHQDGSLAEVLDTETEQFWRLHASGDGTFNNHRVRFELINQ